MAKSVEKRKGRGGIFSLIGKSFTSYFKNLNLALPFLFLFLFLIIIAAGFTITLGPSIDRIENFQFDPTTLGMVAIVGIVFLLALIAGTSFITSGIVGMASEIAGKGKAGLSVMFSAGSRHWLRFLGVTLIIFIVVFVPLLVALFIADPLVKDSTQMTKIVVLVLLILAMMLFLVFFAFAPYLLVMKNLRVFAAIKESFAFAKKNYLDSLLLVLILTIVSILINQIPYVGWAINILLLGPVQALALIFFINSRR